MISMSGVIYILRADTKYVIVLLEDWDGVDVWVL